ncbi:MAG: GDP-perosamine synthase RfbE/PerA [Ignavibacteriaceae bacterium]
MKFKYPVYRPFLNGKEQKYVNECLNSTWISSKGKFITRFEKKFSEFIGVKYSLTVPNGTIALHLALLGLGIGKEDEVIVPSFTYIASVNAITYTGAKPVFAECLESTWQLDPDDVTLKINKKTKAIMAVHLYGNVCEMDKLREIARKKKLFIVEDSAESFGSKYKDIYTGNFGDISAFSFFGNKTITTGEGGMVCTNNKKLYEKCLKLKGQGLAKNREYWHDVIGFNYRMTNICAAIGLAQLENADKIILKKRKIAEWYGKYLGGLPVCFQKTDDFVYNSNWMITILVEKKYLRNKLRDYLKKYGIETRPTFFPVHKMPMYRVNNLSLPVTEDICYRGINLPSYPALSQSDIIYIASVIRKFYENC